jgi:hypothetical protein
MGSHLQTIALGAVMLTTWLSIALLNAQAAPTTSKLIPNKSQISSSAKETKPEPVVALVLDASGQWEARLGERKQSLQRGDAIRQGWQLKSLTKGATISLVLIDGTRIKCPGHSLCACAMTVQAKATPASHWWSNTIQSFGARPQRWIMPISRAGSDVFLADSVLKLSGSTVDFSPVFEQYPHGKYNLRLDRIDDARKHSLRLPLQVPVKSAITVPQVVAGLYRLSVLDADNEPTADVACVLISDRSYEKDLSAFQEARTMADGLKQDVDQSGREEFLRHYMALMLNSKADNP